MEVVRWIDPPQRVALQLNTFTPVGTAIIMLEAAKKMSMGCPSPTANIWWAQTPKLSRAMATVEAATNS